MNNLIRKSTSHDLTFQKSGVHSIFYTKAFVASCVYGIFIIILVIFSLKFGYLNFQKDTDFDYLIFSQRWLPSACIHYVDNDTLSAEKKCKLPENYNVWTIHGLWPSYYHKFGPFFCNKSMKFNIDELEPIIEDLELYWPNIEAKKSHGSLWVHEWLKHGTCAAELESLDSEVKYFNHSVHFFKQYNVNECFQSNNILPSSEEGYKVLDLFSVIKNSFKKNPHINCFTEVRTKKALVMEVRICLDKNLELMDCEELEDVNENFRFSKTFTNCPTDSLVWIPNSVDDFELTKSNDEKKFY